MIDRCLLGICGRLLYILFAAFPSLVYGPSVCHSLLVKVEQTITSNPIENPAYIVEYNNYFPRVKVGIMITFYVNPSEKVNCLLSKSLKKLFKTELNIDSHPPC